MSQSSSAERQYLPIALWGVMGFALLLVSALYRLTPLAIEPIAEATLSWWQGVVYIGWVAFMAYTEGYKTFHQQVAPRVVARGFHLARHPRLLHVLLAPLYCMALFHARRARMAISWAVLLMILVLVISVRQLSQPWRGIVDGGVVIGLGVGVISLLYHLSRALTGDPSQVSAELPER